MSWADRQSLSFVSSIARTELNEQHNRQQWGLIITAVHATHGIKVTQNETSSRVGDLKFVRKSGLLTFAGSANKKAAIAEVQTLQLEISI